jgi:predicted metal-dependent RNase
MKLTFCGGASEVGASFLLLQIDNKNIVIDCGIRMSGGNTMPDFSSLEGKGPVDAIILTHAHMDHSGALPVLSREYPNAKIYMTHASKDLIQVLLYDSLKIMEYKESEIPIFAELHVKAMLGAAICFSPGHSFKPFLDSGIEVTFYSAGHIAGAVCVYVRGDEGSFFCSGDFSVTPQMTVEGAAIPKLRPDVAVFESTYGDRLHADRALEEDRLIDTILSVISKKGKLLIPAFALGRAQEVILMINRAINKKQLPKDLKVYVDGMVNDICRIFMNNPNYLKTRYGKRILKGFDIFYNDNVIAVKKDQELRNKIVESSDGLVVISSSGMLTGGPSQWYAERLASGENNYIALTGYQDEESPGRQLLELLNDARQEKERVLKLGEKSFPLKCEVNIYRLSAHADKMEIIALAHALAAKEVFLVHGNEETVYNLGQELQREYRGRVYVPKNGESFVINVRNKRKQIGGGAHELFIHMPAVGVVGVRDGNKVDGSSSQGNTYGVGGGDAMRSGGGDDADDIGREINSERSGGEIDPEQSGGETLASLWSFVLANYGMSKALTIEDLYWIRFGTVPDYEQDFIRFRELVNHSPYFEPEMKRPFIFHAVEQVSVASNDGYMEVNQMLTLAGEYFPPETGLYKKGARLDEKIALLYFNFPAAAANRLSNRFTEFEQETNWKVELNSDCNLVAAEQLIASLLPTGFGGIKKNSYYRMENSYQVVLEKIPGNIEEIKKEFYEMTGISLSLSTAGQHITTAPARADKSVGQMEQNMAFQLIDRIFTAKPHKLYKKSLKIKNGEQGIELSFISPSIGKLYQNEIDQIECKTYWKIWLNPAPNQHELMKTAAELLTGYGVLYKKLSYIPDKGCLQVVYGNDLPNLPIDGDKKNELKQKYQEQEGIELRL